jgi:hypothetical protein
MKSFAIVTLAACAAPAPQRPSFVAKQRVEDAEPPTAKSELEPLAQPSHGVCVSSIPTLVVSTTKRARSDDELCLDLGHVLAKIPPQTLPPVATHLAVELEETITGSRVTCKMKVRVANTQSFIVGAATVDGTGGTRAAKLMRQDCNRALLEHLLVTKIGPHLQQVLVGQHPATTPPPPSPLAPTP